MAHGELTHGMALGGHILLGNHEFIRIDGLMPVAGSYPGQAPRTRNQDPVGEPCLEWHPRPLVRRNRLGRTRAIKPSTAMRCRRKRTNSHPTARLTGSSPELGPNLSRRISRPPRHHELSTLPRSTCIRGCRPHKRAPRHTRAGCATSR